MESLYHHSSSTASSCSAMTQSIKTESSGQGFSLQSMSAYSHEPAGNLVGQTMQSNIFANSHSELPRSPQQAVLQHQHQQLQQQQLLNQNVQRPHIQSSSMQSKIQFNHQRQQEQHNLSLPTEVGSLQQTMSTASQDHRRVGQHPNATILQQNHHFGMQEKHQQMPPYQQNISTMFKQSSGLKNNVTGLQQPQQQKFTRARSDVLNMQPQQHALHILQQPEVTAPQKNVQQTSQPIQLDKLLGLHNQRNSLQESTQKRHQTSAALLPQTGIIDHPKHLEQSQRVLPEGSSASVGSTSQTRLDHWHGQAYQQLESAREMFLTEAIGLYNMARESSLQSPSPEIPAKYDRNRIFIGKSIRFLKMSRADIDHQCSKDKFYDYLNMITDYFNLICSRNLVSAQQHGQQQPHGSQSENPQPQQQINTKLQFHSVNRGSTGAPAGSPQLSTHQAIPSSQANKTNFIHKGSSSGSEPNNARSPLQHGSTHQLTMRRLQQTNTINSLHDSSLIGMEQRNLVDPLLHNGVRSLRPNMLNTLQQTNFSHMTTVNTLDPTTNPCPSSSTTPFLNLKQQPIHQMMQTQTLKQSLQQPSIEKKKKQMSKQKMHEINEPKPGQVIGFSSGMLKEHHSVSQHMQYSPQSLLPSIPHLNSGSPQTSHHSSQQPNQFFLLSPLSKAGTHLQCAASQFTSPSPSTPLTPSSLLVDLEKNSTGISPLSAAKNTEHTQTPEILASSVLEEFTGPQDNQETNTMEPSLKCLLELVETISPRVLSSSVQDIGAVIDMTDRISVITASESRVAIGDYLGTDTSHRLQGRTFSLDCGSASSKLKKRSRSIRTIALDLLSSPFNENDGLEWPSCQTIDMDSTATSRIKRPRTELNCALLEEIKETNQKLVETLIDVVLNSTEGAVKAGFGEGTIVRCSYSAIGLGENFNQHYASARTELPILAVKLLVPADYPKSSPIFLNTPRTSWSEAEATENLSEKAKLRFSLSLRKLSQPMSLGEMARTWDVCARTVLSDFAQSMGGGSFSSTYGTWENCITAA
ncbi:mediator of RNA polymerase II transcription subunit 15a-like isoform X1 [Actinidia eriantha]|uniref:mediator of RNA polymerase II transcription subunit 15a-like isoform X1 n=2 Tax=Actinidia eriantha TaxID=165200 RepID=UPI0025863656|nr:mediator of RNA polymerase II transcription subunit 15a-like isoform X1 [Actinidia eriantha]XP_057466943.1 mediator of RNA polymerase II transcription subunit 15a-like isoform X1 [Actinidia eriantha]